MPPSSHCMLPVRCSLGTPLSSPRPSDPTPGCHAAGKIFTDAAGRGKHSSNRGSPKEGAEPSDAPFTTTRLRVSPPSGASPLIPPFAPGGLLPVSAGFSPDVGPSQPRVPAGGSRVPAARPPEAPFWGRCRSRRGNSTTFRTGPPSSSRRQSQDSPQPPGERCSG